MCLFSALEVMRTTNGNVLLILGADVVNVGYIKTSQITTFAIGGMGYAGAYIRPACGNLYPDQINGSGEANGCGTGPGGSFFSGGNAEYTTGVYSVLPLSYSSSWQTIGYFPGPSIVINTNFPVYPDGVGFTEMGYHPLPSHIFAAQWARVRNAPPNGAMPSAFFDPVVVNGVMHAAISTSITTTTVHTTTSTTVTGTTTATPTATTTIPNNSIV